jgi:hypothetical protein
MGLIHPGTGYNFVNSEDGASLEILFPEVTPYGPEQFKVEMDGDNVRVAKGRLLAMHSLTESPVYSSGQALLEFNVEGFAVYPTGTRTEGTDIPNSLWASDGYVTIQKYVPAEGEEPASGSNTWGVYIIRNQAETGGYSGSLPVLAVMANDDDAWTKSTAFPTDTEGQYRFTAWVKTLGVTVDGEEGGSGNLIVEVMNYILLNYAAERIKIASIVWTDADGWTVKQLLIGSLTLPPNITCAPTIYSPDPTPGYPGDTYPGFASTNNDWWGAWTGYTKCVTGGCGYTTSVVAS